jgi:hypothetical protein
MDRPRTPGTIRVFIPLTISRRNGRPRGGDELAGVGGRAQQCYSS